MRRKAECVCCYFLRTFGGAEHVRKQLNHRYSCTVSYLYIQYFNTAGMFQYVVLLLEFPNYFVHRILPAFLITYLLPLPNCTDVGSRHSHDNHSKKTYVTSCCCWSRQVIQPTGIRAPGFSFSKAQRNLHFHFHQ